MMRNGGYNEKVLLKKKNEIVRINQICEDLFSKDYILQLINNLSTVLCHHYPPKIIIPYQKNASDIGPQSSFISPNSFIMQGVNNSLNARCRNRFVVPSLTLKNKFLCRSSTLSSTFEIYGRQCMNSVFGPPADPSVACNTAQAAINSADSIEYVKKPKSVSGKEAFDKIRGDDKNLLDALNIKYIFDLMLENKKMMFGLAMSSSEKIDRHNRYKDFNIISLPYPGCEFFNDWRSSSYRMVGLYFDWDNVEINSRLQLQLSFTPAMTNEIRWDEYKNWDLTSLTTNYLKLIIGILIEDQCSLLIHCISGWDRTPLFISLVRCMLWADGLIHQSLNVEEMLYLTLAYDWYLFGHQTKQRLQAGEEILKFTFSYLNHIARDLSTSVNHVYGIFIYAFTNNSSDMAQDSPAQTKDHLRSRIMERTENLERLSALFHSLYNQELSLIVNNSSTKGAKSLIYSASSLVNGLFSYADSRSSNNQN